MERLGFVTIAQLLLLCGCSSHFFDNPRQIFFSKDGDTVSIASCGDFDILRINGLCGEGYFSLRNEPFPVIQDVINDTIYIQYNHLCNVNVADSDDSSFLLSSRTDKDREYFIKIIHNYSYNGEGLGFINGKEWDYNYSYLIDSVVHLRDSFWFYKKEDVICHANQRDVIYDNQKKDWEIFYTDSVYRDGFMYKIKRIIVLKIL